QRLQEDVAASPVGADLPGAAVADRDILDLLVRAEFERYLIAGRGLDLDHLVRIIIDHLDARIAGAGLRPDLGHRRRRRGQRKGEQEEALHSSTSGPRGCCWPLGRGAGATGTGWITTGWTGVGTGSGGGGASGSR